MTDNAIVLKKHFPTRPCYHQPSGLAQSLSFLPRQMIAKYFAGLQTFWSTSCLGLDSPEVTLTSTITIETFSTDLVFILSLFPINASYTRPFIILVSVILLAAEPPKIVKTYAHSRDPVKPYPFIPPLAHFSYSFALYPLYLLRRDNSPFGLRSSHYFRPSHQ
ncbi:hypothetical protein BDR06DRAFT_1023563 [Suillus hirtellus]|nr:hypothetical protein BDR06DRAFT_1023563 [Suillus hirtellus]